MKVNVLKNKWLVGLLGVIVGALIILTIRLIVYKPPANVHYHANFAVYINGQREPFKAINYYEETAAVSCASESESEDTAQSRVHMHAGVNDVIHVHDKKVSWGNFFTVLGWNIGKTYVATRDQVYTNNAQSKVTYYLNGKPVSDVANTIINDQDKLLVNYGSQTPDAINQEYGKIQNKALQVDQSTDPASCGGKNTTPTFKDRLKHMF